MLKYDRSITEHEKAAERVNNEANSSTIIFFSNLDLRTVN
jgi:hypothetical protein